MGLGTLTNRSAGQTILDTFFNDIHSAINGDFVGRNTSGVPTSGQNLGTSAIPWGTIRASSVVLNGSTVDTSQLSRPQNLVTSGKTRTTSNQPAFITPTGSAASFTIYGSTTNLVFDVNGTSVSVTTDIAKTGLTTGPAATNTCLINDSEAAAQDKTRHWGEENYKTITVDTMGANFSAKVGTFQAMKLDNGTTTEYFYGYIESSVKLSRCYRGFFYNSSLAPTNRIVMSDNNVITILSTGWVFVENNATTVDVSYTNPVYSTTAPASPATGDYWYDLSNNVWKRYDGASFQIINRTLVGVVAIDSTNCVAARCMPFYKQYSTEGKLDLQVATTEIIRARNPNATLSVAGNRFAFVGQAPTWNITTMLAAAADMYNSTEQASTYYYLYIKDTGETIISDIAPYGAHGDKYTRYHPHNPWRMVGVAFNNGSSNLTQVISGDDPKMYFRVTGLTSVTGGTAVIFSTLDTDLYSMHNLSTGKVQIPKSGVWLLSSSLLWTGGAAILSVYVNTTLTQRFMGGAAAAGGHAAAYALRFVKDDIVELRFDATATGAAGGTEYSNWAMTWLGE
jgi:hypothetical protein